MTTMRELTKDQADLKALVEAGEICESIASDTFEGMQYEIDQKITNYCQVINSMESDLTVIQNEFARLKVLETQKKNQIKALKQHFMHGLIGLDQNSFDVGLFKGHIRKGSQSVKVSNADDIPAQFIETKVQQVPDKTAIKNALKAGEKVSGAELVTGESSLIIK